jgi:hypothetical protein
MPGALGFHRRKSAQNHPVWAIAEDHVNSNLLFAGTEFGLFFSIDGGQNGYNSRVGCQLFRSGISRFKDAKTIWSPARLVAASTFWITTRRCVYSDGDAQTGGAIPSRQGCVDVHPVTAAGGRGKSFQANHFSRQRILLSAPPSLTI